MSFPRCAFEGNFICNIKPTKICKVLQTIVVQTSNYFKLVIKYPVKKMNLSINLLLPMLYNFLTCQKFMEIFKEY